MKTTCEVMVQKVLPAIRAELSRTMIFEYGCTQQDVADILELSRAAVSQYVSEKRGAEVGFSEETQSEIRKFASVLLSRGLSSQEKAKACAKFAVLFRNPAGYTGTLPKLNPVSYARTWIQSE